MAVATPIPFVKATFFDRCGNVLAGGKVFTYEPRSTTPKVTYNAPISGTPNTNPVILDAAGQADIYLYGRYRIIVQDAKGVVVNDSEDIGSWYSGDLDSQLDSVNQYLTDSGDALIASQQQRIDEMVNNGLVGAGSTDLLVALSNGSGRNQRDKNNERPSPEDFYVATDGDDWRPAFQRAIDFGQGVKLTAGKTYLLKTKLAANAKNEVGFLTVPDGTTISGPRSAIVKIDADIGDYTGVFIPKNTTPATLNDVNIYGFTIDQNAQNNSTADVKPNSTGNIGAAIAFIRTCTSVYASDLKIINAPGINTILMNGGSSYDCRANDNTIYFLKGASSLETYDNSAIYIESNGYQADRNTIYNNSVDANGKYSAGRTAVEVHGSMGSCCDNSAFRFMTVANVVGNVNSAQDVVGLNAIVVSRNKGFDCRSGIALWALAGAGMRGFSVTHNVLSLNPSLFSDSASVSCGVTTIADAAITGDFLCGDISDNIIYYSGNINSSTMANRSAGINIDAQGSIKSVTVRRNKINNAPCNGISVFQQTGAFDDIVVEDNTVIDAGQNASSNLRHGVLWRGLVTNSRSVHNKCVDTGATLKMQSGTNTSNMNDASSVVVARNRAKSPNSATALRNFGLSSDMCDGAQVVAIASNLLKLSIGAGYTQFLGNITGAATVVVDTASSYPLPTGTEILVTLVNTSGAAPSLSWSSTFVFASAYTQLTAGQRCTLRFVWDGAAQKMYQSGSQIITA